VPPLGNRFDSALLRIEVCHRSQLHAAIGSDSIQADDAHSAAAIVGFARKTLTGAIMARTRLEVNNVPTPSPPRSAESQEEILALSRVSSRDAASFH
jgi:hypothetical protein